MDETMRLRLDIAYDGTDFSGWARDKHNADEALRNERQKLEGLLKH